MVRMSVKYSPGPLSIDAPSGSRTPVRAVVFSVIVVTSFGSNCGSENTQVASSDFTFSCNSLTRFAPGRISGDTVIEPTADTPKRLSKY